MSGRKPVCKRFLNGECNAHNCKFYHPKPKQQHHVAPTQHENRTYVAQQHVQATPVQAKQHTHNTPVQAQPTKSVSELIYERMLNYDDKEDKARARARARAQRVAAVAAAAPIIPATPSVSVIPTLVAKPGSFGAKLNSYTMPKFNKTKFQEWLYNDMPNIDGISIISLYSQLLKVSEDEILEYCTKTNALIPDIMALLGHGLTNKKWLKELHGRFLGESYNGIKSFNMKTINDLLTFTLVQIYVKTSDVKSSDVLSPANIEKIISLYVCIMRIIGKFGIVLEIDDINTIEKNYNSNKYEMFCN
jgi:hypothetical protein